ncbi:MAG: prepilin-type N-terminal cleavage/methylation domain-containing protein [Myxococcota bacterium]|nr:prepilin-type N-terminal cleavage/methylation domain-containing protein [Myxococcota bacterium]
MSDRGNQAGFTLIELTVSLVAGLIVAMGIIALSRESTRTFHEEVRSAAAEATLRTAIDRLRADLQRAGFMSTANIMADPLIARPPTDASNVARINAAMIGIRQLAGIHLLAGASAGLPLAAKQAPALSPDAIEIGGNMASTEQFEIQSIQPAVGTCQQIFLSAQSAVMYRINAVGSVAAADLELKNLFQPAPTALKPFIARIVDDTGRSQYVATCTSSPTGQVAGLIAGSPPTPYVWINTTSTPLLTPQQTSTVGGVSGFGSGRAWINPVQIVRWQIVAATAEPLQYQNALAGSPLNPAAQDPNKYDLIRSFVDATDTVVAETTEVVAEYAVDLEFAFSIDSGSVGAPVMQTFPFESATNQTWADVATASQTGPQRIRAVRVRLVTRTAQPDRSVNVAVPNPGTQGFLYRYCVNFTPTCATNDGVLRWARARTVTTEVSLPNQQGAYY